MKSKLRQFVSEEILAGRLGRELRDDEDLLASGLVDSRGMMRLVGCIDVELGIAVPPEDVTIERFSTIEGIAGYLAGSGGARA